MDFLDFEKRWRRSHPFTGYLPPFLGGPVEEVFQLSQQAYDPRSPYSYSWGRIGAPLYETMGRRTLYNSYCLRCDPALLLQFHDSEDEKKKQRVCTLDKLLAAWPKECKPVKEPLAK